MGEALILLLNLLAVTYLCWLLVRADKGKGNPGRPLGLFAYKDEDKS